ncbi:nitroreductase [Candidatus Peregrinibacteria bacterium CG11_big_fil_rev_8_21_14_0_20_46_8]|nr:MAG: nitroreductase [Candidatus Peregrinibacteria bacterium CG11_big_fil_rev_8_21_14_0_20_46_8]
MEKTSRKSGYPISDHFLNRWSPRAMSAEPLTDDELMPLFEAARWAPSSYNNQPWRFIYAKRDTEHWEKFFNLMVEFNQNWAKNAAVLVVVVSKKTFDKNEKPSVTHAFDAGAAWENLALEAAHRGLVAHGMEGFDYEKAQRKLNIPDDHEVHAMIAIGKRGKKEDLPEKMQEMEVPSERRPLEEIVMEGSFRL